MPMNDEYNPYRPSLTSVEQMSYGWWRFVLRVGCLTQALEHLYVYLIFSDRLIMFSTLNAMFEPIRLIVQVAMAGVLSRATGLRIFLFVLLSHIVYRGMAMLTRAGLLSYALPLHLAFYTQICLMSYAIWRIPAAYSGQTIRQLFSVSLVIWLGLSLLSPSYNSIMGQVVNLVLIACNLLTFASFWNFDFEKRGEIRFNT